MERWIGDQTRHLIVHRLSGWKTLPAVIPEIAELLADPVAILRKHEIRIGPLSPPRLAIVSGTLTLMIWGLHVVGLVHTWLFAIGAGVTGAAATVGLVRWLLPGRHEMVLHADGVELKHGYTSVWCPWSLFNVTGTPFVNNAGTLQPIIFLPVAVEAIPLVELRHDERCVAQGMQAQCRQLQFSRPGHVTIPSGYEVFPEEVAELLLRLGRQIAAPLPRSATARDAPPDDAMIIQPATFDPKGWIALDATQLNLPAACCDCGQSPHCLHGVEFTSSSWFTSGHLLRLNIPLCNSCVTAYRRRWWRSGFGGAFTGLLVGCVAALLFQADQIGIVVLTIAGGTLGWRLGVELVNRRWPPVKARFTQRSLPRIELQFVRPNYAQMVLAMLPDRGVSSSRSSS